MNLYTVSFQTDNWKMNVTFKNCMLTINDCIMGLEKWFLNIIFLVSSTWGKITKTNSMSLFISWKFWKHHSFIIIIQSMFNYFTHSSCLCFLKADSSASFLSLSCLSSVSFFSLASSSCLLISSNSSGVGP